MADFKYSLCPKEKKCAAGVTDLKEAVGRTLDCNELTVLLPTEGAVILSVNFQRTVLRRGDVALLFPDIVCTIRRVSAAFSARFLSFSAEVVEEAYYKNSSTSLWEFLYQNPVCRLTDGQRRQMRMWCEQTRWMIEESVAEYRPPLLRNQIFNLFSATDSELKKHPDYLAASAKRDRSRTLLAEFYLLLGKHCHEQREVNFYAERLCITPDYLYKLTNRAMQMTPKQTIDQQALVEIKTYLTNTDLSVKGIAEAMHFEDSSYLCRFFRRMTGMSPMEFRNGN